MVNVFNFAKITDEKVFEQLTMDLLEAEGFQVAQELSTSGSTMLIRAEERMVSHSGYSQTLRWLVQCKNLGSKRHLRPNEISLFLANFNEGPEEGLLIVTDTLISEETLSALEDYVNKPNSTLEQGIADKGDNKEERERLVALRTLFESRFSVGELRTICFDLGIDYEGLPGDGKFEKVREMITFLDHRDRIDELVEIGKRMRPNLSWGDSSARKERNLQPISNKKPIIKIWDQRQLENRLLRHPFIADKYQVLTRSLSTTLSPFDEIDLHEKKILIISDTSPFAYQLFTSLNRVNPNVQMITVWQYGDPIRDEFILKDTLSISHDLVLFFLGDSFGFPIPERLQEKILSTTAAGKAVILFPFFAWVLHQGAYQVLDKIIPVRLIESQQTDQLWLKASRILSSGDISWLNSEAFIENQPVTINIQNEHPILKGIDEDFNIIHSFEFLALKEGARILLEDNLGYPFLIVNEAFDAPVVYINSCTHNCLTKTQMFSPFEVSEQYQKLIVNTILWSLGLDF